MNRNKHDNVNPLLSTEQSKATAIEQLRYLQHISDKAGQIHNIPELQKIITHR